MDYFPGNLRSLHEAVHEAEDGRVWEHAIVPRRGEIRGHSIYFAELREQCFGPNARPPAESGDSWNLFAASVLNNVLLTTFQENRVQESSPRPFLCADQYRQLWEMLGFTIRPVSRFHPFFCEIVGVVPVADGPVRILEEKWPCLMLGSLLFSRAGVVVEAPPESGLSPGVADSSKLYWCDWRINRDCHCLSHGWGHNSMWRTHFRIDLETNGSLLYNAGVNPEDRIDLGKPKGALVDSMGSNPMPGFSRASRIEFLRHRCETTRKRPADDYWPYYDTYSEEFDGIA